MATRSTAAELAHQVRCLTDSELADLLALARAEQHQRAKNEAHQCAKARQRVDFGPEGRSPAKAAWQLGASVSSRSVPCLWCAEGRDRCGEWCDVCQGAARVPRRGLADDG